MTFHYCVKKELTWHLDNLKRVYERGLIINCICALVVIVGQMSLCWLRVPKVEQSWITNIELQCGPFDPDNAFGRNTLKSSYVASVASAAYFGLVIA